MIGRRALLLAVLALAGCQAENAGDGCGTLELTRNRGMIDARFAIARDDRWRVVFVHEGHVAWRGYEHGAFTVQRRFKDYHGPDHVTVRASGSSGAVCTAGASIK